MATTPLAALTIEISSFGTTPFATSDGLLAPQLEKQGILGNTTGRRPGDVTLQRWNALAIDVAITSALGKKAMRLESPCEEYGVTQKHGKYKSFAETNYSFCAMVWETLGSERRGGSSSSDLSLCSQAVGL